MLSWINADLLLLERSQVRLSSISEHMFLFFFASKANSRWELSGQYSDGHLYPSITCRSKWCMSVTLNKGLGKTWHVLSLQWPGDMWSIWWMAETWMSRHRMGSSPFFVLDWLRLVLWVASARLDRHALVWTRLVIFFSQLSSDDYLSGLLMDCCIEVSKLFHFSDSLYDSESC